MENPIGALTRMGTIVVMKLDDLMIPRTAASRTALEVASTYCSPALLNHSVRAYLWAAAHGTSHGIPFDAELLYVAALLHDLGLVAEFDSHTVPFEAAGGHVAWVFAAGAGWPAERRQRLSDVIVRHMWGEVPVAMDPEGYLLARSTGTDISGRGVADFTDDFRSEVLRSYPRLGIADEFVTCFRGQAQRKPDSAAGVAMRGGIADRIAANPLDQAL